MKTPLNKKVIVIAFLYLFAIAIVVIDLLR